MTWNILFLPVKWFVAVVLVSFFEPWNYVKRQELKYLRENQWKNKRTNCKICQTGKILIDYISLIQDFLICWIFYDNFNVNRSEEINVRKCLPSQIDIQIIYDLIIMSFLLKQFIIIVWKIVSWLFKRISSKENVL